MAKIVVVGAGFAGHFAAMTLSDQLRKKGISNLHQVEVISRLPKFNYIPSLIWVGIGQMPSRKMQFELAPVYKKMNIGFTVGKVFEVHPDNKFLLVESPEGSGSHKKIEYDYLIMATGPLLNFAATPGLGPDNGFTLSVCNPPHAEHTAKVYLDLVKNLENGQKANIVIGTGHGTCTCQGAALEYLMNVHHDLERRGLRHLVTLTWLTNEPQLGDLGIGGVMSRRKGQEISSEDLMRGLFEGYGIKWQIQSHVFNITSDIIEYEKLDGEKESMPYDFAMLLPPFKGQAVKYVAADGSDLTEKVCNPAGFVKVDGVYGKSFDELDGSDWPKTYQSPVYDNIFAAGIAFAPPGPISVPNKSPSGTVIAPAPPRTGFTSELCGHAAALNVIDLIEGKKPSHHASMAGTAGLCVASMDKSMLHGNAMIIGIYPVAKDRQKYGPYGRDLDNGMVDVGLSGAWFKMALHYAFMYKLQGFPLWQLIP